jgi:hypothetical protein
VGTTCVKTQVAGLQFLVLKLVFLTGFLVVVVVVVLLLLIR